MQSLTEKTKKKKNQENLLHLSKKSKPKLKSKSPHQWLMKNFHKENGGKIQKCRFKFKQLFPSKTFQLLGIFFKYTYWENASKTKLQLQNNFKKSRKNVHIYVCSIFSKKSLRLSSLLSLFLIAKVRRSVCASTVSFFFFLFSNPKNVAFSNVFLLLL